MQSNRKSDLTLYSIEACPYAQRSRILLEYKEVFFKLIEIDITKPRPDWFLDLNPAGKVPVIVHKGQAINESSVINEYLDEVFNERPMLPEDPFLRAQARIMIDFCNKRFSVNMYRLLMEQDPEKRKKAEEFALADWKWLDSFLARNQKEEGYVFGEFGLVDLTFAPFFARYILNEYFWDFKIPSQLRHVAKWRTAISNHSIVSRTSLPDEHLIKFYADYSLGYANGAIPAGHAYSSADTSVPLETRPMPQRRF